MYTLNFSHSKADLNNFAWRIDTSIFGLTRKLAICARYGKLCQRFLWYQLALASCEFYMYV